jgi:hypothetical protein
MDCMEPDGNRLPNHVTNDELHAAGYHRLHLTWRGARFEHPLYDRCRDFDVAADVPQSQGLYLFGLETAAGVDIRYVGMTTHLWMVTRGRLPDGRARGGQRYGRPRHAGPTRQRINAAMTAETERGAVVGLWINPRHEPGGTSSLRLEEEKAIERWQLRSHGLNRGGAAAVLRPHVPAGDSVTNRQASAPHTATAKADEGHEWGLTKCGAGSSAARVRPFARSAVVGFATRFAQVRYAPIERSETSPAHMSKKRLRCVRFRARRASITCKDRLTCTRSSWTQGSVGAIGRRDS